MTHPGELAAQLFVPSLISVGALVALAALLYGLVGENPVGPVTSFLSDTWEALSPFVLLLAVVWGFHLISYLLVGSFAKDVWSVAAMVQRLAVCIWRCFFSSWISPALCHDLASPPSRIRPSRRSLLSWLGTGWRAGDSVHLE